MLYDVIILGAGPAGLSAALYAGRACLKTLLIEKAMPGGQITLTNDIENYPGQLLEGESGFSLTERMGQQADKFGVERAYDEITDIDLSGEDIGFIIGHRGETLDALQYLTSLQVNKGGKEYRRVTLDTEGYRAKREQTLIALAGRMANKVHKSGRRMMLEPMNPYERRILHATLQDHPYVTTHSEGDEPNRRVVIAPKRV